MTRRSLSLASVLLLASGSVLTSGCGPGADFETFMRTPLPANVTVTKFDGNWGADPWRCWEIAPASEDLKRALVEKWNLTTNPQAFNGVASGNHIYCKFEDLLESYSGEDSESYRAVGIDATRNVLVVYFYNG